MGETIILSVKVVPNKRESRIVETSNDGITRIELKAQPIEGKANQELIRFLAKLFNLNKNQIRIVRGLNSKNKVIKIESIEKERIYDILGTNFL